MTKPTTTLVVASGLCLLAALWWRGSQDAKPSSHSEPATATGVSSSSGATGIHDPRRPSGTDDAVLVSGEVSADENELLTMYDEMAAAFTEHHGNCWEMADAIETAVDHHANALVRVLEARSEMTPEQIRLAQRRLDQKQGPRMDSLRHSFEQAVAKCKHNDRLMNAVRSLATLKAPS